LSSNELQAECALYRNLLREALVVYPSWANCFGDIDQLSLYKAVLWFWSFNNSEICKLAREHPKCKVILYEDLVSAPLKYASLAYDHLGLSMNRQVLARIDADRGTSVWGKLGGTPNEVATSWKTELEPSELVLVNSILKNSSLSVFWN
jgi:hypothetical protein